MTEQQFTDRWSESGRDLKPVGGQGIVAAVLIGIATVADALSTWTSWHGYQVAHDYVFGTGVTDDDLDSADQLLSAVSLAYLIAILAAGVAFIVWLWRARGNAEIMCYARHRRGKGWIIGSWICPVVNAWFPFMIVDDVYRASRPDRSPDVADLRTVPGSRLLGWWWACLLAAWIVGQILLRMYRDPITIESLRSAAIVETIGSGLMIGAAVLIIMIMRRISGWQTSP